MLEADEVGFFAFGVVVSGHLNLYPVMKEPETVHRCASKTPNTINNYLLIAVYS